MVVDFEVHGNGCLFNYLMLITDNMMQILTPASIINPSRNQGSIPGGEDPLNKGMVAAA